MFHMLYSRTMQLSIVFALFLSTVCASTACARTLAQTPATAYNYDPPYGCFYSPPEGAGFVWMNPCDPGFPSINLVDTCKRQVDAKVDYRYNEPFTVEECCYMKNLVKFGNARVAPEHVFDYIKPDPRCPQMNITPCARTNRESRERSDALECCEIKKARPAEYKADLFCSDENYNKNWL